MNKYKIILIDLDDTIFNFKLSEQKSFIKTCQHYNYEASINDYYKFSEINEKYFNEFAAGKMTRKEFHHMRFKLIFDELKICENPDEANLYFIDTLSHGDDLIEGAEDLLKYLSKKYKIYVASNGIFDVQKSRLISSKIYDYFSGIYVSSVIGFNKPKKEFFDYIFNDLNSYKLSDFLMVGDRIESDILGAKNAGIDTLYFNEKNKADNLSATYMVNKLSEIKNIL